MSNEWTWLTNTLEHDHSFISTSRFWSLWQRSLSASVAIVRVCSPKAMLTAALLCTHLPADYVLPAHHTALDHIQSFFCILSTSSGVSIWMVTGIWQVNHDATHTSNTVLPQVYKNNEFDIGDHRFGCGQSTAVSVVVQQWSTIGRSVSNLISRARSGQAIWSIQLSHIRCE